MLGLIFITRPKAPRQVHTWPLLVVWIPRIKNNHPFFTLSINPHTLSLCIEYYGTTYHGINYGHARSRLPFKLYKFFIRQITYALPFSKNRLVAHVNVFLKITMYDGCLDVHWKQLHVFNNYESKQEVKVIISNTTREKFLLKSIASCRQNPLAGCHSNYYWRLDVFVETNCFLPSKSYGSLSFILVLARRLCWNQLLSMVEIRWQLRVVFGKVREWVYKHIIENGYVENLLG